MVWATNTGVVQHNPLAGIAAAFKVPEKQNQPTLPPSDLPLLLSAVQAANIKVTTRSLILWQLHTMTRPSEAAGARWDEIDIRAVALVYSGRADEKATRPYCAVNLTSFEAIRTDEV